MVVRKKRKYVYRTSLTIRRQRMDRVHLVHVLGAFKKKQILGMIASGMLL